MLIKNLTVLNFQSYYDSTSINFSDGLNLIIGNGGKGKSKLFNAFYWVLFGDIYITDIGWCSTNGLPHSAKFTMKKHEFINKKALHDCQIGDSIRCCVSLELESEKGDLYTIERTVKATRSDEPDWTSASAWEVSSSMLKVSFDSPTGTRIEHNDMAEGIINDLFPAGIRGYIWFQGESLDNLINFRKPENLKDAVKHISYFPYYEKLTAIIANARQKIEKQESKHLKEINKQNSAAKTLLNQIEQLRHQIDNETENKKKHEDNIARIQIALASDESKVGGLAKFSELVSKYKDIDIDIKDILNNLTNIDSEERRLLPSLWVLRNTEPLIKKCGDIIKSHVEEECTAPEKKYLDNPSKSKLEEILNVDHQCFVCGCPVDEDHPQQIAWIKNRLKMQEDFLREMEAYRNNIEQTKRFNMLLGKIADYPDRLLFAIGSIDKQFQELESKIDSLRIKYRSKNEQKRKLDEQIEEIKKKNGVDPKRDASSFTTLDRAIKATRTNLEREQKALRSCDDIIKDLKSELALKEKELIKTGSSSGFVSSVEETEWKTISMVLEGVCKNVQEKARKELLRNIEQRANEFYERFTKHDIGYKGRVQIGDDYSIQYDAGLNTSHEDRKKMSIINALLSLNQEALNIFYPFISDAPTSSFDPSTTHKYLTGIKDIFHQSIIMTKDVIVGSENYNDLLEQEKVSRIYQLSSHVFRGDDKEPEIYEVCTEVKQLK